MASSNCDMMMLSIQDLNRMKLEFPEHYSQLMEDAYDNLQKALILKLQGMQKCQDQLDKWDMVSPFEYEIQCIKSEKMAKSSLESLQDDKLMETINEEQKIAVPEQKEIKMVVDSRKVEESPKM